MDRAALSSIRRLSDAAGLSHNAVTRVVHGDSLPEAETVSALASALRVPESTIYKLTHGQDITPRAWEPPAEVHRLTKREQDALTEMIRSIAAGRDKGKQVGHHDDTSNTQAAGNAATEDELARRRRPGWDFEYESQREDKRAAAKPVDGIGMGEIPDEST